MSALDTTKEAADCQLKIQRRLGPESRFTLAVEMSQAMLDLAKSGIRHRHPNYSEEKIKRALIKMLYGIEVLKP